MATVHSTTIPCEPYTAHKVQMKESRFCNVVPCAKNIVWMLGLKILELFCTFSRELSVMPGKCTSCHLFCLRRICLKQSDEFQN